VVRAFPDTSAFPRPPCQPKLIAVGIDESSQGDLAGNHLRRSAERDALRFEVTSCRGDICDTDVDDGRARTGLRRSDAEPELQTWNVGVDVRELQVIAALDHFETERALVKGNGPIEIGDAHTQVHRAP